MEQIIIYEHYAILCRNKVVQYVLYCESIISFTDDTWFEKPIIVNGGWAEFIQIADTLGVPVYHKYSTKPMGA